MSDEEESTSDRPRRRRRRRRRRTATDDAAGQQAAQGGDEGGEHGDGAPGEDASSRARGRRGRGRGGRSSGGGRATKPRDEPRTGSGSPGGAEIEFTHVDSTAGLEDLCAQAREEGRIGIDTEFLWERTYAPQLCLVQLRVGDANYLADPLEDVELGPVTALVDDPDVEVIMHAPHADMVAFCLREDATPTRVFDTQLSAGFIGLSAGLAYEKLVREVAKRRVQPSESFTDWSRRPLNERQLRYAAEDVEHLYAVADRIVERLRSRGREEWAREELARRFDGVDRYVTEPEEAWRKVGRRGKLGPRELAVLREVAAWRERLARVRDLPAGWIAKDPTLVEVSRRKPASAHDLGRIRGVDGSMKQRDREELLEAIERGLAADEVQEDSGPPLRGVRRRVQIGKGLATALLRARCEQEELAPELVGTSSDVEHLLTWVSAGRPELPEAPAMLRGWREPFGREIVDLAEGRIDLRLTDSEPYIVVSPPPGAEE